MNNNVHSISKSRFKSLNESSHTTNYTAPKYISTFLNNVNGYAHSTRKETVGDLATDVFPEYLSKTDHPSPDGWKSFYLNNYTTNYNTARKKLKSKFEDVKKAINNLTDSQIEDWLDDLLFYKTFNGLYVQQAILKDIADHMGASYTPPSSEEEGQGIDGFINGAAYSIKPETYKDTLAKEKEKINAKMVYYKYIYESNSKTKINKVEYYIEENKE